MGQEIAASRAAAEAALESARVLSPPPLPPMRMTEKDEPLPTSPTSPAAPADTAERPQQPRIRVAPDETGMERARPGQPSVPPSTASQQQLPRQAPQPPELPPPRFDPLPPLVGRAGGTGAGLLADRLGQPQQSSRTEPSLVPDSNRVPRGTPEMRANPRTPDEIREAEDIRLQNESAELLSRAGYNVEYRHNRPITAEEAAANSRLRAGRRPDYNIEGRIFDHLAPMEDTSVRNIITRSIKRDKIDAGQATRFVINLDRSNMTLDELREQLQNHPVDGLDEIIIIRDGRITPFYPFN